LALLYGRANKPNGDRMFTYEPSDLSTSDLYKVRLNIGNTNEYDIIVLQDEEINYILETNFDSVSDATTRCLDLMITRAGLLVDSETGQTSESLSKLLDNLIKTRNDLLNSVSRNTPIMAQFTGVFEADRKEVQNNSDVYHDGLQMTTELPGTGSNLNNVFN
jgi:hypothetical protein